MGVVFSLINGSWLSGMGVGLLSGVIFSTIMCIWMNWFIRKRIKESKSNQPDFGDEDIDSNEAFLGEIEGEIFCATGG